MGKKKGKCVVAMLVCLLLVGSVVFAAETGRGVYTTPNPALTQWLNQNDDFYHSHAYEKYEPQNAYGLGLDVNLWNVNYGILDKIGTEYKYDINNDVHSVYGVLSVDLTKLYQK